MFSALLALCEGNPLVTGEFLLLMASNTELRCFFLLLLLSPDETSCWANNRVADLRCHDVHVKDGEKQSDGASTTSMGPHDVSLRTMARNVSNCLCWSAFSCRVADANDNNVAMLGNAELRADKGRSREWPPRSRSTRDLWLPSNGLSKLAPNRAWLASEVETSLVATAGTPTCQSVSLVERVVPTCQGHKGHFTL